MNVVLRNSQLPWGSFDRLNLCEQNNNGCQIGSYQTWDGQVFLPDSYKVHLKGITSLQNFPGAYFPYFLFFPLCVGSHFMFGLLSATGCGSEVMFSFSKIYIDLQYCIWKWLVYFDTPFWNQYKSKNQIICQFIWPLKTRTAPIQEPWRPRKKAPGSVAAEKLVLWFETRDELGWKT